MKQILLLVGCLLITILIAQGWIPQSRRLVPLIEANQFLFSCGCGGGGSVGNSDDIPPYQD